jgi:hypothetical protein
MLLVVDLKGEVNEEAGQSQLNERHSRRQRVIDADRHRIVG